MGGFLQMTAAFSFSVHDSASIASYVTIFCMGLELGVVYTEAATGVQWPTLNDIAHVDGSGHLTSSVVHESARWCWQVGIPSYIACT